MKAQAFLELVGEMLRIQQDYFQSKREGLIRARDLLITAKRLEKQVMAVVKEGRLEPDVDVPATATMTEEEYKAQLSMFDYAELEDGRE